METHRTADLLSADPLSCVGALEEGGMPYTYLRTGAAMERDASYTFEKGLSNVLHGRFLKVVSQGYKIVTDPDAAWRVDRERIMHEEWLATLELDPDPDPYMEPDPYTDPDPCTWNRIHTSI